jgi:hypothetical protein
VTETLCPSLLRREPQLAPLDMLTHATEIAIIALCASHPRVEHELDDSALPGDITADRIIDRAMALLDAVDRYRLLLHDPRALDDPPTDIDLF